MQWYHINMKQILVLINIAKPKYIHRNLIQIIMKVYKEFFSILFFGNIWNIYENIWNMYEK